ncbi:MAG: cyclic pyranopterin monophosphate synthase MoaC [Armatimonadota bacterium]|nr:cyclic pyranopterin monophosphate synthase MoaC [Armatimonadota bacterium]MDR7509267.1 cyclic pyranopterin monophosphate synthase MoaC [Armatimonadota bacterium]MDR7517494.1 cyclic pyranopterin monophosphate synthase MoaC [Armatimonadota bacterium]MDR7560474.1 cyclic pyranopterin monophosphate synthase MoaC [Armatimonadota bacterium]MDR7583833.1 cyclic pyranopterin monophosphate synthase MoaC [Armatimonadota bacterium]
MGRRGGRARPGELTHVDASGRLRMVDVSDKPATLRVAVARGEVRMRPATLAQIRDHQVAKGDVLAVAHVAGVLAAKRADQLIPLAHPLPLTGVDLSFRLDDRASAVQIEATVRTRAPTGVEMEALVAVAAAALTIYDMCKAVDREMTIDRIRLVRKTGGRSGDYRRPGET